MHETEPPGGSPRRQPQQARSRDKVDRILEASAELLQECSYEELGTRLIAERAQVSVGSLYRFFPDKDGIARALLLGWFDKLVAILGQAGAGNLPDRPSMFVEQVFDAYAEFFRHEPGFRQVFFHAERNRELELAGRKNDEDLAALLSDLLANRYGLPAAGLDTRCLIAVRVGNCMLKLAFRDDPEGDRQVLDEAKVLLCRYLGI